MGNLIRTGMLMCAMAAGLFSSLPEEAHAALPSSDSFTLPMPRPVDDYTAAVTAGSAATMTPLATMDETLSGRPGYAPINIPDVRLATRGGITQESMIDATPREMPQFQRPDSFTDAYMPGKRWMMKILSIDLDAN